jgi:hypothetical protein
MIFHGNIIRTPNMRSVFCRVKWLVNALLNIDWFNPGFQGGDGWMDDLIRQTLRYWAEDLLPPDYLRKNILGQAQIELREGV